MLLKRYSLYHCLFINKYFPGSSVSKILLFLVQGFKGIYKNIEAVRNSLNIIKNDKAYIFWDTLKCQKANLNNGLKYN